MTRRLSACLAVMIAGLVRRGAGRTLCPKCRDLMFIDAAGTCVVCGGTTASGALKLCPKCSASLHRCEHCLAALDADAKPLPAGAGGKGSRTASNPPEAALPAATAVFRHFLLRRPARRRAAPSPSPSIRNKAGTYVSGRWQYTLEITDPGTRAEGAIGMAAVRWAKTAAGARQRLTTARPGGPSIGSMCRRRNGACTVGCPFRLPRGTGRDADVARRRKPRRSPWFEIGKADNGKRAQVPVGQWVLVRLRGNPTTGYQWQTAAVQGQSLRLMAEPQYVATPVKPGIVGSGGTLFFKFRALQPGLTTIKLSLPSAVGEGPTAAGDLPVHGRGADASAGPAAHA